MQPVTKKIHPQPFERAREAVVTIRALRPALSESERETLALLLDSDAMETIEKSGMEAAVGEFEPLEQAVAHS